MIIRENASFLYQGFPVVSRRHLAQEEEAKWVTVWRREDSFKELRDEMIRKTKEAPLAERRRVVVLVDGVCRPSPSRERAWSGEPHK